LILRNPAPVAPVSGSAITEIFATPNVTSGAAFWDPDLYARMSERKKKRGSIISRGTLVVCNVSLVGQWMEEAKSKLKNPGLVYSYHGQGRKRDPHLLAQNSIVVTTYETLASDATLHAARSGEGSDYTAPCEQVRWWRVICDESHSIRNKGSKATAIMELAADNKWLVSGKLFSELYYSSLVLWA
jgi:SNF2 family DNA or RNA helicase